jgi:excisionase family DNA binding protein
VAFRTVQGVVVTPPGHEPLPAVKPLYRVTEAMVLLSMSLSVIFELIRSGRLRSVKEGRARYIPASAITEYVALLEQEARSAAGRDADGQAA